MCFFYTGSGYAKNVGMGPICKWKFAHPPPYYVTMLGALCDFFSHTRDTGSYQRNALWRPFRWNNHSAGRFFKINNKVHDPTISFVGRFSEIFFFTFSSLKILQIKEMKTSVQNNSSAGKHCKN